jgi:hypothetical protein
MNVRKKLLFCSVESGGWVKSCLISRRERPLVSGITVKYIRLNRGKGHVRQDEEYSDEALKII